MAYTSSAWFRQVGLSNGSNAEVSTIHVRTAHYSDSEEHLGKLIHGKLTLHVFGGNLGSLPSLS